MNKEIKFEPKYPLGAKVYVVRLGGINEGIYEYEILKIVFINYREDGEEKLEYRYYFYEDCIYKDYDMYFTEEKLLEQNKDDEDIFDSIFNGEKIFFNKEEAEAYYKKKKEERKRIKIYELGLFRKEAK